VPDGVLDGVPDFVPVPVRVLDGLCDPDAVLDGVVVVVGVRYTQMRFAVTVQGDVSV
jgi:hypothetical protein